MRHRDRLTKAERTMLAEALAQYERDEDAPHIYWDRLVAIIERLRWPNHRLTPPSASSTDSDE